MSNPVAYAAIATPRGPTRSATLLACLSCTELKSQVTVDESPALSRTMAVALGDGVGEGGWLVGLGAGGVTVGDGLTVAVGVLRAVGVGVGWGTGDREMTGLGVGVSVSCTSIAGLTQATASKATAKNNGGQTGNRSCI